MKYFCTLFDSYYLNRGLVLYRSMEASCKDFHLFIFAFDDIAHQILKEEKLAKATVISLSEFENDRLRAVKGTRSKAEYCWTCTPSVIEYCLNSYTLPNCTYIDADLFFFNDPAPLFEEMGNASVLITEHRYSKRYDQSAISGIYCVQFVTFINDDNGRQALSWWVDRCIEWCYSRPEDGKFGDQKYLDDWPERFRGVHVLKHLGGGVAPWNVQQYELGKTNEQWFLTDLKSGGRFPIVFYHFHHVNFREGGLIDISSTYHLKNPNVVQLYRFYLGQLLQENRRLLQHSGFSAPIQVEAPKSIDKRIRAGLRDIYRKLTGRYNVFVASELIGTK